MELNNMLKLVGKMHAKFGITSKQVGFSHKEKKFRYLCMLEEINEYDNAETKVDELDALVDLVVFALGTAERQGMIAVFEEAFNRVMEANNKKEIGPNQKRGGFMLDLQKPKNWVPANLDDLVKEIVPNHQGDIFYGE